MSCHRLQAHQLYQSSIAVGTAYGTTCKALLGFWHEGSGFRIVSKAPCYRPLVGSIPQHLLPPITTINPAVVHDQHHNWQLIPTMQSLLWRFPKQVERDCCTSSSAECGVMCNHASIPPCCQCMQRCVKCNLSHVHHTARTAQCFGLCLFVDVNKAVQSL